MKLMRAIYTDSYNNSEWEFKEIEFDFLPTLLYLLMEDVNETPEDRRYRTESFLNGEVVCTNIAAYKLIKG